MLLPSSGRCYPSPQRVTTSLFLEPPLTRRRSCSHPNRQATFQRIVLVQLGHETRANLRRVRPESWRETSELSSLNQSGVIAEKELGQRRDFQPRQNERIDFIAKPGLPLYTRNSRALDGWYDHCWQCLAKMAVTSLLNLSCDDWGGMASEGTRLTDPSTNRTVQIQLRSHTPGCNSRSLR